MDLSFGEQNLPMGAQAIQSVRHTAFGTHDDDMPSCKPDIDCLFPSQFTGPGDRIPEVRIGSDTS
ncbi:hypothetical protein HK16_14110 [Acetobacter senegalensis]|uniref:Uncharacterized protein n=1 Tax=Acetobacter senegalensis TaxID=446692 RepID=A0A252EHA6_9PROT|nr:hypothetical protein HK16_14110 [Acetobacter senegalensis]